MKHISLRGGRKPWKIFPVGVSIVFMVVSEIILIFDILSEFFVIYFEFFNDYHIELETLAVFTLGISLIIFGTGFWHLLRQNEDFRISIDLASGEFLRVLEEEFDQWDLTVSERQVGLLLIKGLTIREIAGLRETSEGTIKSQSNSIYRKAGVKGRNELVAYFIEDLLCGKNLTVEQ